jgi:hypothetical protein
LQLPVAVVAPVVGSVESVVLQVQQPVAQVVTDRASVVAVEQQLQEVPEEHRMELLLHLELQEHWVSEVSVVVQTILPTLSPVVAVAAVATLVVAEAVQTPKLLELTVAVVVVDLAMPTQPN